MEERRGRIDNHSGSYPKWEERRERVGLAWGVEVGDGEGEGEEEGEEGVGEEVGGEVELEEKASKTASPKQISNCTKISLSIII